MEETREIRQIFCFKLVRFSHSIRLSFFFFLNLNRQSSDATALLIREMSIKNMLCLFLLFCGHFPFKKNIFSTYAIYRQTSKLRNWLVATIDSQMHSNPSIVDSNRALSWSK